ncbi:MAG TPA: hypothetical protein VKD72_09050 [Gemmataceae bacterium]|nr:hypothetical protein [Gemmataceae bacterium]
MSRISTAAWLVVSLAALGSAGCGPQAQQSDPVAARTTLGRVLDAWQKGDSLESFRGTSPRVTVIEPQWKEGARLIKYVVEGEPRPSGFDLLFSVKLSLQDRAGMKKQVKAKYTVSTAPALVVIRAEES